MASVTKIDQYVQRQLEIKSDKNKTHRFKGT
jgi:hypothetical protein